jgi:exoribonuclease-2
VAAWLDGQGPLPPAAARVPGMDGQLQLQDGVGKALADRREQSGALEFESIEPRPVFDGERVVGLATDPPDRAKRLIAELMIAANQAVASFLDERGSPSLRRVVRAPERWAKIAGVAADYGETLPSQPDSAALETFLARRRAADPLRFPDLSLVIVKLMGRGEYVAQRAGEKPIGHFGLALRDYAHSTAPNRRFPDLITQRLIKAALGGRAAPYGAELVELAAHCTEQESNVAKVERQVRKSAAALVLEPRLGERFDGVVTGVSESGTFVRIFDPPAEGRVVRGYERLRVGDAVRVTLVGTNFERGFIDFERAQMELWRGRA